MRRQLVFRSLRIIAATSLLSIITSNPLITEGEPELGNQSAAQQIAVTQPVSSVPSTIDSDEIIVTLDDIFDAIPQGHIPEEVILNAKTSTTEYERYVTDVLNVREKPDTGCAVIGKLVPGNKVTVTGEIYGSDFVRIDYKGSHAYVHSDYLTELVVAWQGQKLTKGLGTVHGPSGKETYYNLPMGGVIKLMNTLGYNYLYWVREDGVKMYGNYIMVAADTNRYPKGTIVETSLGTGCVVDHCESAEKYSGTWFDIAVTW